MYDLRSSKKDDEWFHVVLNYKGLNGDGGMSVYINGVLEGITAAKYNLGGVPSDGRVVIGKSCPNKDKYHVSVMVDELTLWNRTLCPKEIQAIYNMHA